VATATIVTTATVPATTPTVLPTDTPIPPTDTPVPPTPTPIPPTATPIPPTPTFTFTPIPTRTFTSTPIPTDTATPTFTPTPTHTSTSTPTFTPTPSPLSITTTNAGSAIFTFAGLAPGNTVSRNLNITNNGGLNFTYTLATSCTSGCSGQTGLLWTDATNGLQLVVKRGSAVIYSGPISVSSQDMGVTLGAGQSDTVTLEVSLPATVNNAYANLTTVVTFTWTATQSP
jgi:hypothetical protein